MRMLLAIVLLITLATRALAINGTANQIVVQNGTVAFANNPIRVNEGGTGVQTFPNTNAVVVTGATGTSALSSISNGSTGNILRNSAGTIGFGTIDLSNPSNAVVGTSILGHANGGTDVATATDDNILVGNGTVYQSKAVPDCQDVGSNHLSYTASTNTFSCGTASASSFPHQSAFGTNGDLGTGTNTIFASFAGSDSRESAVQMPINSTSRVWNNYRCKASAAPGGSGIVIELRKGACGSQAGVVATDCAIASGATTCTGEPINSAQSVVTAGHCLDWSIVGTATTAAVQVVCTVEQTS